jgi:hypothetical protein
MARAYGSKFSFALTLPDLTFILESLKTSFIHRCGK